MKNTKENVHNNNVSCSTHILTIIIFSTEVFGIILINGENSNTMV